MARIFYCRSISDTNSRDRGVAGHCGGRRPHSVAVLLFADLSPEQDQEYFTDGFSEEILNRLSAFHVLKVIARTASFAFKNTTGYIPGRP